MFSELDGFLPDIYKISTDGMTTYEKARILKNNFEKNLQKAAHCKANPIKLELYGYHQA